MDETAHNYKIIEVVGTSAESWEDAAKQVIKQTGEHLKDLRIAEVVAHDAKIEDGEIVLFRTKLKLSFKYHGE